MLFKKIETQDIEQINNSLLNKDIKICDFTLCVMFLWQNIYNIYYHIYKNNLILQFKDLHHENYAILAQSDHEYLSCIDLLSAKVFADNSTLNISLVEEEKLPLIQNKYQITFANNNDYSDYLYNIEDLLYLKGKKFHNQRNLINLFLKNYSDFEISEFKPTDIEDIKQFISENYGISYQEYLKHDNFLKATDIKTMENFLVFKLLDNIDALKLDGMVLRINSKIQAFCFGKVYADKLFVHVEKANKVYKGIYQFLNNSYLKYITKLYPDLKYVNREEDMGDLGLRQAKLSYNPCSLVKKFEVKIIP